jgi:hypothetical protein
MQPSRRVRTVLLLLAVTLCARPAPAQTPAAGSFKARFSELRNLELAADQAATVHNYSLTRDAGTLVFQEGTLQLFQPLGGRRLAAAFKGQGSFRLKPPSVIEQERLRHVRQTTTIEQPFEEALLFFADSTMQELAAHLDFGPPRGSQPNRLLLNRFLDLIGDPGNQWAEPDVLRPVLNDEQTGLFAAYVSGGTDYLFLVDPHEVEGIRVLFPRSHSAFGARYAEVATQFQPAGASAASGEFAERRPEARIAKYVMEVQLPRSGMGDLSFSADTRLDIVADTTIGPWVAFTIFPNMELGPATWEDQTAAEVFLPKESPYVWVNLGRRMTKGETRTLRLSYHGDLIDRFSDWFYIKSSITWYPRSLARRSLATFDMSFLTPDNLVLAAVGERTDSAAAPNHMVRTRWVTAAPIRNASFNIGRFDQFRPAGSDVPPVTVLWSENMHRQVSRAEGGPGVVAPRGKHMDEQVGNDVVNALRFYQHVYGDCPVRGFLATEIPWAHGEAWPGIIGLSAETFQQTSTDGSDEIFRAHEVAHQWWGISVDYATYHDRWLSEGMADFSGLWYLQARRKDNRKYFEMLDHWQADLMERRDDPLPIWLGERVATARTGDDYGAIIYEKGAWVMHMLRILLLDLPTMSEDRFTDDMRAFYAAYAGHRAATADLQHLLEQRTGLPMDWFFNEWIYGTGIPTYKVATHTEETGGKFLVKLRVDQEHVPPGFLMYVPVTVEMDRNQVARFRLKVTGARSELSLPPLPAKPKKITFNDLHGVLAEVKETDW